MLVRLKEKYRGTICWISSLRHTNTSNRKIQKQNHKEVIFNMYIPSILKMTSAFEKWKKWNKNGKQ